MKDIETIIPFLREYLNERGLENSNFTLVLDKLPNEVINQTYPNEVAKVETLYSTRVYLEKKVRTENDTIILQSNIFNQ
jgi:hypothetical protein